MTGIFILIILIIIIAFSTSLYFFIKKINELKKEAAKQRALLNKFLIEEIMLSEEIGEGKDLFKENLSSLAKRIFEHIKTRYNLKSTDYSEIVEEIRNVEINPKIKSNLIEFFESMCMLEYSGNPLTESERKNLREKAIELIKNMAQLQIKQEENK
jgi:hypothetical protein